MGMSPLSTTEVHPRACGGNHPRQWSAPARMGPSPRVRGKPGPGGHPIDRGGSIPARAGETPSCCPSTRTTRVHPRACGGNSLVSSSWDSESGPSPRVRGKPPVRSPPKTATRSIPARTGETPRAPARFVSTRVHPRACGGNLPSLVLKSAQNGPSPRVRGKLVGVGGSPMVDGSIPARAGETNPSTRSVVLPGVHPRACGGNPGRNAGGRVAAGPSPRVRGKLPHAADLWLIERSIPARAGETRVEGARRRGNRVHPRACGGNIRSMGRSTPYGGPSPRVRGKLLPVFARLRFFGSIPARAGKRSS